MGRDTQVAEHWREPDKAEEYLVVIRAQPGVNETLEDAIMAGLSYVADTAQAAGIEIDLECGRVDHTVSYTPRPSLTSHTILISRITDPAPEVEVR
jgi:hypothetical protein